MSNTSGPAHRSVSNIRPTPTANSGTPTSPQTPLRTISSTYGSPSSLRAEEDCVVIEIGSRYLRAGFAGDAVPKAVVEFGPEEHRRAGDYRKWEADYDSAWAKRTRGNGWGEAYELWKPDLRGVDLGLVGDKIERALRESFTKYLLIDSRPRRMTMVIPSALPLPLLSTILDTVFDKFQPPSISLMSAPVLVTVAAGLRSALVVDIGWAETVVTSIYEYREVQCNRSIRASKLLGEEMYKMLASEIRQEKLREKSNRTTPGVEPQWLMSFEECEEVTSRIAWCRTVQQLKQKESHLGLTPVKEENELTSSMRVLDIGGQEYSKSVTSVPLNSTSPPRTLRLPFLKLSEPCETALFAAGILPEDLDDEELPLHLLVYRSLLQLPVDVRSMCMSRIVFVGGGSNLPGLKDRVMDEVISLIEQRGWDPVQGKAVEQLRTNPKLQITGSRQATSGPSEVLDASSSNLGNSSTALATPEPDPIEDQLKHDASKHFRPVVHGTVRVVDSIGAWSGASLLQQLKIVAVSVIDREQWMQHGVSGASKATEVSIIQQRQSIGPGAFKSATSDRSSWTLGPWA